MSAREDCIQAVRDYLETATGLAATSILVGRSGNVVLPSPCVIVLAGQDQQVGLVDYGVPGLSVGDPTRTESAQRELSLILEVRGTGADDLAESIDAGWWSQYGAAKTLRDAGYATVRKTPVLDLTQPVDTGWLPRYQMTLVVGYRRTASETTGTALATVDVEIDYTRGLPSDPQLESDFTVTAP